ncbi:MAG TPA: hypothetical protein VFH78_15865 [Candidatus Thermoplasmatota archaeon]|nr:hypothetical protein [Candidatus Thermoplasmatota archaeon]
MKALLVALLALPLAATASLGHEAPPRRSAHEFTLELVGLGLGAGGRHELAHENCVVVRAHGAAHVLGGRATLARADAAGPARLELEATAPRAGREAVAGAAPLAMELRPFELGARDQAARVAVHLAEGAVAAAAGTRVTLALTLEHVGAPLSFAVEGC